MTTPKKEPAPNYGQLNRLSGKQLYRYLMFRYGKNDDNMRQVFARFGRLLVEKGRMSNQEERTAYYIGCGGQIIDG